MTFLNHSNNLSLVTLPSPSSSADSVKLQSKLEALRKVKELCEFYENSNNSKNDPKNVLVNLCDGLETFLGFNSDSKGYTGEGIVYSDLDRLCDAVMAFLSGVLNEVKNDPSVTTYYKDMETTLKTIKQSMHNPNGLSKAVEAVSDALGEWDGNLTLKKDAVINRFNNLNTHNFDDITKKLSALSSLRDDQLDQVASKIRDCITAADQLHNSFIGADAEVHYLDNGLKHKLQNTIDKIEIQVERFVGAAKNDELKQLLVFSTDQLKTLGHEIDEEVDRRVKMMGNKINDEFIKRIVTPTKKVESDLTGVRKALAECILQLQQKVGQSLVISDKILGKVDTSGSEYRGITQAAQALQADAEELWMAANDAQQKLNGLVDTAKLRVDELNTALGRDLTNLKTKIKKEIESLVDQALIQHEAINRGVQKNAHQTGDDISLEKNWMELYAKVTNHIEGLLSKGEEKTDSLGDIVEGVWTYATNFKFMFGAQVMEAWLNECFEKESVKTHLMAYVNHRFNELNTVKMNIKNQITAIANKVGRLPRITDNVEDHLTNIHETLMEFAGQVDPRIANSVAGSIDAHLRRTKRMIQLSNQSDLETAVKSILTVVQSTARGTAAEIEKFKNESSIGNLKGAIEKIESINVNIKSGTGAAINTAFELVKEKLKLLGAALKKDAFYKQLDLQLPDEDGGVSGSAFLGIGSPIKFDNLTNSFKNEATGPGSKKALNEAISAIQTHIKEVLHEALGTINRGTLEQAYKKVTEKLDILCDEVSKLIDYKGVTSSGSESGLKQRLQALRDFIDEKRQVDFTAARNEAYKVDGLTKIKVDLGNIIGGDMAEKVNIYNLVELLVSANTFKMSVFDVETNYTIRDVISNVTARVDEAAKSIQNKAKISYHDNISAMFTKMKKKVKAAIADINDEITNDLRSGLKGLLRTMCDRSGDKLTKLTEHRNSRYKNNSEKLKTLSDHLQKYLDPILNHTDFEVRIPSTDAAHKIPELALQANKVRNIKANLDNLLQHLTNNDSRIHNYDHQFTQLLSHLSTSLASLTPSAFANPRHPELLDAVKKGLQGFVDEMERVYVNGYEGHEGILLYNAKSQKVTAEGKTCAKVLFTVFEILFHDLDWLRKRCKHVDIGSWRITNVRLNDDQIKKDIPKNKLGHWLRDCGFSVPTNKHAQDGELTKERTGQEIYENITKKCTDKNDKTYKLVSDEDDKQFDEGAQTGTDEKLNAPEYSVLRRIVGHLKSYYQVCHLGTTSSKTQPSSVHKMLVWLAGFPYSPGYQDFSLNGFDDLFEKDKQAEDADLTVEVVDSGSEGGIIPLKLEDDNCLDAYPKTIKALDMSQDLTAVCTHAHSVLTAILGHGHENSVYACDYNTNHYGLYYPSDNGACLDMLADILNRLFHQLRFVYGQCINGPGSSGWAECWYGKEIGGSRWSCNTKQCPNQINGQPCNQMVNQMGNQMGNQKADQTCDKHPTCGLKSPLQSFLEDGLQGFLPHQFAKPGCKLECTVTKHRGIPCKTPMGFADIASMASHTQQGSHLMDILKDLCGDSDKPLSQLCATLNCLMRRTPQTLGDMFAFYHQFLYNWNNAGQAHKRDAFDAAVRKANFGDMDTKLEVIPLQQTKHHANHAPGKLPKLKGDLFSLTSCNPTSDSGLPCGPYLQSISDDITMVFSNKYSGDYVSWVVYITETFYDLLKKLYDDCCNRCNKKGRRCYDKGCDKECQVRFSHEYRKSKKDTQPTGFENIKHRSTCNSIVQCRSTHALIYASGFTFGSPYALSGVTDRKWKRTCEDFCTALGRVISDAKADEAPLAKLIYVTIPNFLFAIRAPFIWLNVALWLLSLFYLLHIMVIRLDLLHIKSHLHSPSSHRIAAQSLLAAARVNKLGRVFYLQP